MSKVNQAKKQGEVRAKFRLVKSVGAGGRAKRNGDQGSKTNQLPLPYQYSLNSEDSWSELLNEYYRSCHSCDYLK